MSLLALKQCCKRNFDRLNNLVAELKCDIYIPLWDICNSLMCSHFLFGMWRMCPFVGWESELWRLWRPHSTAHCSLWGAPALSGVFVDVWGDCLCQRQIWIYPADECHQVQVTSCVLLYIKFISLLSFWILTPSVLCSGLVWSQQSCVTDSS